MEGKIVVLKDRESKFTLVDPVENEEEVLAQLQGIVGGYIEMFYRVPSRHRNNVDLAFYCNEEGRLQQLPPCCTVFVSVGHYFPIVGPLFIMGTDANTGEEVGLTPEEIGDIILTHKSGKVPIIPIVSTYRGTW